VVVRSTVLVAPAEAIPLLQQQPSLQDSRAFAATDAASALDAIKAGKPQVVAVERNFASTASGQAFLARLQRDPDLKDCDVIRVGVRRAIRHAVRSDVTVFIDGEPATLLDLALTGCCVTSASMLKPQQRVRVVFREGDSPVRGVVAWASLELPKEGPRYRAGIEFGPTMAERVEPILRDITK